MMARENMEEWGTSAWVELETVRATIEAYQAGLIELPPVPAKTRKDVSLGSDSHPYTMATVAQFLGWTKKNHDEGHRPSYACETAFRGLEMSDGHQDIPGHQGYRVSPDGGVESCLTVVRTVVMGEVWRPLRTRRKGTGPRAQLWATLYVDGRKCEVSVTRLLEQLWPPPSVATRAELLELEVPQPGET